MVTTSVTLELRQWNVKNRSKDTKSTTQKMKTPFIPLKCLKNSFIITCDYNQREKM